MKALCAISSVEFNIEHFPGSLYSREISHPVFYLPQKKLLSYLGKWSSHELTSTDSYLLFLALLNSSDLVKFRVPAFRSDKTNAIVANNMEALAKTVIKLNTVQSPSFTFPQFAISTETRFLENVSDWIKTWDDAYEDYKNGKFRDSENRKLAIRETALERLIKSPHRTVKSYASSIADWAEQAGSFPTFLTANPYSSFSSKAQIKCSDYWKIIIVKCANDESVFSIDRNDILEILTHCEENIPIGNIFSNALFKILRTALERQKNYLGLGDIDISAGKYQFLSSADTVETANIKAMIDSAPADVPKPESYPSKLAYLRAKMRWELSQDSVRNLPDSTPEEE